MGGSGDRGCDLCHILFERAVNGGESKEIMNMLNGNIKKIRLFFFGNVFLRIAPYIFENSFISSEY